MLQFLNLYKLESMQYVVLTRKIGHLEVVVVVSGVQLTIA